MAAASYHRSKFVHRTNPDGSVDSVCTECFATVATAVREGDLRHPERTHACDPWTLARFKKLATRSVRPVVLPWRASA